MSSGGKASIKGTLIASTGSRRDESVESSVIRKVKPESVVGVVLGERCAGGVGEGLIVGAFVVILLLHLPQLYLLLKALC